MKYLVVTISTEEGEVLKKFEVLDESMNTQMDRLGTEMYYGRALRQCFKRLKED